MSHKPIWERSHRGTMNDKKAAIARYFEHMAEVKAAVPEERLRIFSVDKGCSLLCNFLEVEIPDKPFPNLDDRKEIKKTLAGLTSAAYIFIALGIALTGVFLWGILSLFN